MYQELGDGDPQTQTQWVLDARDVLRGREAPLFAHLTDRVERRRLAAELMLRSADEGMDEGWWRAYRAGAGSRSPQVAPLTLCFCGVPVGRHLTLGAPDISRAWHAFLEAPDDSDQVRMYRQQAAAAYGYLLQVVVTEAHSENVRRSAGAWQVLEGIDRGQPLIPLLRQYLNLTAAQVRASRDIPREAALPYRPADAARRMLRMLHGIADDLILEGARDWRQAQRWLPVIGLLQRRGQRGASVLYPPTEALEEAVIQASAGASVTKRRALLRSIARGLRNGTVSLRDLARGWLAGASPALDLKISQRRISLSGGWRGRWLADPAEVKNEGRQMKHCAAGYAQQITQGTAAMLALLGPQGERATLLLEGLPQDSKAVRLELAGVRNQPVDAKALMAAAEAVQALYPGGVRVCF